MIRQGQQASDASDTPLDQPAVPAHAVGRTDTHSDGAPEVSRVRVHRFALTASMPRREPAGDPPSTNDLYLRLEGHIYGPLAPEEVEGLMGSGLLTGYEVVSCDLASWTPIAYHPRLIATRGSDVDTTHSLLSRYSHLPAASKEKPDSLVKQLFPEERSAAAAQAPMASVLRKPEKLRRMDQTPASDIPNEETAFQPPDAVDAHASEDPVVGGDLDELMDHLRRRKASPPAGADAADDAAHGESKESPGADAADDAAHGESKESPGAYKVFRPREERSFRYQLASSGDADAGFNAARNRTRPEKEEESSSTGDAPGGSAAKARREASHRDTGHEDPHHADADAMCEADLAQEGEDTKDADTTTSPDSIRLLSVVAILLLLISAALAILWWLGLLHEI